MREEEAARTQREQEKANKIEKKERKRANEEALGLAKKKSLEAPTGATARIFRV